MGDPWALQILKETFLGVRRFQDFQTRLGITRQTLVLRLNRFTDHALLYKAPARHKRLVYEYRLTPKGADLYAFILMVWRWHRRWHLEESLLPEALYHRPCRQLLNPVLGCGHCQAPLLPEDVRLTPGRGAELPAEESGRKTRILNELERFGADHLSTIVIGDCWSVMVLTAVLRGVQNYDASRKSLQISSNGQSSRLKTRVAQDLLCPEQNPQDRRKISYRATEKGRDVFPMLISLMQWGDRWLAGANGPPDVLWHDGCGHILEPLLYCDYCKERVRREDVGF
ncbi:MAG: winged helix-turn-helix transcriptional regulator, partial [Parahaliea sp.]